MAIIEVNHVTKEFRLGSSTSLKDSLLAAGQRLIGRRPKRRQAFKALDDVSFSVEPGEVVGIIGHNGAGKSTLLKLLANICKPTRGSVFVGGSIAPLIEVGAGLNPELTGRENIFLNSAILGIPKKVVQKKLDEIVEFAELAEFIDTPIKRYSSGMQVRLGFAIATSIDAELLIVDEVLAVGDLAFQRKCFDRMEDMIKRQGKTVLLVSHNIRHVERICSRAILLEKGKAIADGKPATVCDLFYRKSDEHADKSAIDPAQKRWLQSGEVELLGVKLLDEQGNPISTVKYHSNIIVAATYRVHKPLKKPVFGMGIHTPDLLNLATQHSQDFLAVEELDPGTYEVRCEVERFPFLPGTYSIRLGIAVGELFSTCFYAENLLHFEVIMEHFKSAEYVREGFVQLDTAWNIAGA